MLTYTGDNIFGESFFPTFPFFFLLSKNFGILSSFALSLYTYTISKTENSDERGLQKKDKRSNHKKKILKPIENSHIYRVLKVRIKTFSAPSAFCFFNCSSYRYFSRTSPPTESEKKNFGELNPSRF